MSTTLFLHLAGRHVLQSESTAKAIAYGFGDEDVDPLGPRQALDTRTNVHRIADGGELEQLLASDDAGHRRAAMDAHAEGELWESAATKMGVVPCKGLSHFERGFYGISRIPRIGFKRAEKSHEPIAHELRDVTVVIPDRGAHPLEVTVQNLDQVHRVEPLAHSGKSLKVGKKHPDLTLLGRGRETLFDDLFHDRRRGKP